MEHMYFYTFLSTGYNHGDVNESKEVGLEYANFKITHDNLKNITEYFSSPALNMKRLILLN